MGRSTDPNTFEDIYVNLLFAMHAKHPRIELDSASPMHTRFEFYAFRAAWAAEAERAWKKKDQERHAFARGNYEAMARYKGVVRNETVVFTHVSQGTGTLRTYGEPIEDFPVASSEQFTLAKDIKEAKSPNGRGVDLTDLFDDGRTPRTPEALKHSLLANLQFLKDYGQQNEIEEAEKDLNNFLTQYPEQL